MRIEIDLDCERDPSHDGIKLECATGDTHVELTAYHYSDDDKDNKEIYLHLDLQELKKAIEKLAL